jgi:hypothetical protein
MHASSHYTLSHELIELEKEQFVVVVAFAWTAELTAPSVSTFELNKIDGAT